MKQFVADGYAPSLTALAGASLQIYATVLNAQHEGSDVRAKCKDGSEVVFLATETGKVKFSDVPARSSGFRVGEVRDLDGGLEWERRVDAEIIWIVSPLQTVKRFPARKETVAKVMLERFRSLTRYKYLLDDKSDSRELAEWLASAFEGKLRLSDYENHQRSMLEALIANLPENLRNCAKDCPVWGLVSTATFKTKKEKNRVQETLETAQRIKTYWLAELRDGTVEGYSFVGRSDSFGENPESAQLMGMADGDTRLLLDTLKADTDESPVAPPPTANKTVPSQARKASSTSISEQRLQNSEQLPSK